MTSLLYFDFPECSPTLGCINLNHEIEIHDSCLPVVLPWSGGSSATNPRRPHRRESVFARPGAPAATGNRSHRRATGLHPKRR